PVELTVTMSGVFDTHTTWFVMSLVTGGWMKEPNALSCTFAPLSRSNGVLADPKVSVDGSTEIETNCCSCPQADRLASQNTATNRPVRADHFVCIQTPGN